MKKSCRALFFLAVAAAAQAPGRPELDRIFAELTRITGFTIHRPVSFQVLTRAQVAQFLNSRINASIKPSEVRAEELTLKAFGFVPPDFDLKQTTLMLLTEQTAAFYDYHRKRLFLTDWASASLRDSATVHEMAHALADQNYSLDRYARRVEYDSEQSAARQAVVEGQASWLMGEIAKQQPPASAASDEPFPVFDHAPLYLRETLTFPYTYGTEFQQALYARFGRASFRYVFEHPPVSTQQILHPAMYFAGTEPLPVTLPTVAGMKRLVEGPLGELEHSILIRQFGTEQEAAALSPHWRGAHFALWENRKRGRIALVYRSVWDTPGFASHYFSFYRQVIDRKMTGVIDTDTNLEHYSGKSDTGYFLLELGAATVTVREGLPEPPAQPTLSVTGK